MCDYYCEEGMKEYVFKDSPRGKYIMVSGDRLRGLKVNYDHFGFFSYTGSVGCVTSRERGLYRHRTAEADLSYRVLQKAPEPYVEELTCTDIRDGLHLLHQIKMGTIRPYDSYEHDQIASPARETREMLEQLKLVWLNWWYTRTARTPWPTKVLATKKSKVPQPKRLSPKLDRMFRCQAPGCGAVHHGSELTRNRGILLACPEPGCGAAVKPLGDQK